MARTAAVTTGSTAITIEASARRRPTRDSGSTPAVSSSVAAAPSVTLAGAGAVSRSTPRVGIRVEAPHASGRVYEGTPGSQESLDDPQRDAPSGASRRHRAREDERFDGLGVERD